jgi:hypothetical protein
VVESREGELLQSAQSRQRARDRVFYRLKSLSQG